MDTCLKELNRINYSAIPMWIDDNLKWKTNVNYLVKKAAKRLFSLKILRNYNAPIEDLKAIYTSVIRSIPEYCAHIWHGNLTNEQTRDIERIQKRARQDMCINLIKSLLVDGHKLHELLAPKVCEIRNRETGLSGDKFYDFNCRTERFKNSVIVYA